MAQISSATAFHSGLSCAVAIINSCLNYTLVPAFRKGFAPGSILNLTHKQQEIHHEGRRPGEKADKEWNMWGFPSFFLPSAAFVVKNYKRPAIKSLPVGQV
jgi:hypothetical protein